MKKILRNVSVFLILVMVLNISSPVLMAVTDLSKQDSTTKQENVEFDARLCTISENGSISDGSYKETFDIYSGGILQITIKVKETGYLKNAKVRFKNNNYIINDFSHVQIIKSPNATTEEIDNNAQNVLNEINSTTTEANDTSTNVAASNNTSTNSTKTNYIIKSKTNDISNDTATNEITNITNSLNTTSTEANRTEEDSRYELTYTSKLLESTQTEVNSITDNVLTEGAQTLNDEELEEAVKTANSFDFETSSDAPILVSDIEKATSTKTTEEMTGISHNENGETKYNSFNEDDASKIIKDVKEDGFDLNEIVSGRTIIITLPIGLPRNNYVQESVFDMESDIDFEGTYINAKGKEKEVKKNLKENVIWTANVEGDISQKVLRCLKYDGNKILLSMKIKDQIKDNRLPYLSKEININIPTINGKTPNNAIVTGERISYETHDNFLKITKDNDRNDSNALRWASDDTIIITYIYTVDEDIQTFITSSDINTKIKLPIKSEIQGSLTNTSYEITGEQGNIADLTLSGPIELSKGFLYTNLVRANDKFDTNFYEIATINMGYNELIDKVELVQSNAATLLITKKVTVSSEEFYKILGNDGYINVYNESGNNIGAINKDNLSIDIQDISNLRFETSKPIAEGNISLILNKAIPGEIQNASRENIKALSGLNDKLIIKGFFQNTEITTNEINLPIKMLEPKSNATIEISKQNLSTTEVNQDVVITATLETDDINDALYQDPVLRIQLPEDVTNINVKEAKLIFDDELTPTSYNANGNVIIVNLAGTQTKYSTQAVSKGSVIKIVADITVQEYAYTKASNITLNVSNNANGEHAESSVVTNIIAPEQFIITNELKLPTGDTVLAKEGYSQSAKIQEYDFNSKVAHITAHVVNNLGTEAFNTSILGRFLATDTTKPNGSGESLEGTYNTTINREISVSGIDFYKVFYSQNGQATNDLNDPNNGWTEELNSNSKSYLIVPLTSIPNGKHIVFSYNSVIPANLGYDQKGRECFAVYYDNQTLEGLQVVQGKKMSNYCEIRTATKPFLETAISAKEFETNNEIFRDAQVKIGEHISYEVSIINNSQGEVDNVVAELAFEKAKSDGSGNKPSYASRFISLEYLKNRNKGITEKYDSLGYLKEDIYQDDEHGTLKSIDENKDYVPEKVYFEIDVGTMGPGEVKTFTVYTEVFSLENDNILKLDVTANGLETPSRNTFRLETIEASDVFELTKNAKSNSFLPQSEIDCELIIANEKSDDFNKVKISTTLPEGIKFVSGDGFEYNEKKNTLVYNFDNIAKYERNVLDFKLGVNEDAAVGNRYVSFDIEYTENDNKITNKTNSLLIDVQNSDKYKISLSSDKSNGKLLDVDTLEYTLSMQNMSGNKSEVAIDYPMSSQVYIDEIIVQKGNQTEVLTAVDNTAFYNCQLNPDESLVLTIKTTPQLSESNKIISTKPNIKINNCPVSTIAQSHEIIASNPINADETQKENQSSADSIMGIVWNDKNSNGSRDGNEEFIEGVEIILYNRNDNTIAKDAKGVEIKATTDSQGRYELKNIPKGNYYVVAKYDSTKYGITNYQKDNVTTALNSDFIDAMFSNSRIGTSDIISINNANVYNFDLGLNSAERFDLSLDMNITKVTVTNPRKNAESKEYEGSKLLKREFNGNRVDNDTLLVEYTLKVKNEGNLAGYASTIVDYIPDGFTFDSEINKDWFVGNDKNIYSTKLSEELIDPGETKELKIVFTKKMTGNSVGLIHNTAEITKAYNTKAVLDSDSIPGNRRDGEDDISSADIFLGIETGAQRIGKLLLYVLIGLSVMFAGGFIIRHRVNFNKNKINKWKEKDASKAKKQPDNLEPNKK